ncbi:hypothetical protein ATY41_01255 [Leifsonia xyli subsp. xyli]|uniref:LytR/CpsA/Psr regulator C-terminal domain-containing protein n=1 Tax=Leifsonia xyli subsp. xyli TaxID=59736 RepID=A0A1E2SNI8_LEIXY|nr:LytR C-terminal domain-containing protein [Leifsonia xyli]ODA91337.1 hypothetical protein ATY41_01255 [Leifsonia xyli subsp. xyli]
MAQKYSTDRFDEIPDDLQRVGAHRAPQPKRRRWIAVGWAALATLALVGAGILYLSVVSGSISFSGSSRSANASPILSATPTPTIVPTVDPALTVNILNGTSISGLAGRVDEKLAAAGWTVGAVANASRTDLKQTIVYYSDPANQASALGAARSLTGATIQETQDFAQTGAQLTVVVGSDYTG